MNTLRTAEQQIRHARWIIEQALPAIANLPTCHAALDEVRITLGQIAGDYRDGETEFFERFTPAVSCPVAS